MDHVDFVCVCVSTCKMPSLQGTAVGIIRRDVQSLISFILRQRDQRGAGRPEPHGFSIAINGEFSSHKSTRTLCK